MVELRQQDIVVICHSSAITNNSRAGITAFSVGIAARSGSCFAYSYTMTK